MTDRRGGGREGKGGREEGREGEREGGREGKGGREEGREGEREGEREEGRGGRERRRGESEIRRTNPTSPEVGGIPPVMDVRLLRMEGGVGRSGAVCPICWAGRFATATAGAARDMATSSLGMAPKVTQGAKV